MTSFMSIFRLHVRDYDGPDELEAHLDCVVEHLEREGAIDADWAAALAAGQVTFSFAVEAKDFEDALGCASTILRAAIHSCEGATPGWPRVDDLTVELSTFDGDEDASLELLGA